MSKLLPAAILLSMCAMTQVACVIPSPPGARLTVVIRDRASGKALDNCILVEQREATGSRARIIFPADASQDKVKKVERVFLHRINSGSILVQEQVNEVAIPLGPVLLVNERDTGYTVYRSAYQRGFFGAHDVVGAARDKQVLTVELEKENPGELLSDGRVVRTAQDLLDTYLPLVPRGNPAWRELMELLRTQLDHVLSSGQSHSFYHDPKQLRDRIDSLLQASH